MYEPTCEASTTLLCLKGLKSSLTLTGVLFLMTRGPKKGLGVAGADSALCGLGETEAEAALMLGDADP